MSSYPLCRTPPCSNILITVIFIWIGDFSYDDFVLGGYCPGGYYPRGILFCGGIGVPNNDYHRNINIHLFQSNDQPRMLQLQVWSKIF